MSKSILVLTPLYPSKDLPKGNTPVVHYFTQEWVKLGYDVIVINYSVNFPYILNLIGKILNKWLISIFGYTIRPYKVKNLEYQIDGVRVNRIVLRKVKPHGRCSRKQILAAYDKTLDYCKKNNFIPDVIISHWVNPQYEIMHLLKKYYNVPICYIAHDQGFDLKTIYYREAKCYIEETDIIGYRSDYIKTEFETMFDCRDKKSFLCYSGVPESYIRNTDRVISNVETYIYIGTLIRRKNPTQILSALYKSYKNDIFQMTYIGEGYESKRIYKLAGQYHILDNVQLLGYISRDSIMNYLDSHDVFIMISKGETFGLVYLEAMARGCITIASKKEGFDGIIKHGENGFLCDAGNVEELTNILNYIRNLSKEELCRISRNAVMTARKLTDKNVAKYYIEEVISVCN